MPSDTRKAPAFDGAGGRLRWESFAGWSGGGKRLGPPGHPKAPLNPLRGKRAEGGPVHATARFPAAAYGFGVELTVFYEAPALGAFLIHLQHQRALAAATS
ncbi:MAG: hypothetical protein ACLSHC_04995 [Bilophila wadsworthia]